MFGSSLNLAFEFRLYRYTLDKKAKKNNKQFDNRFVEKTKKDPKLDKQFGLINK